MGQTKQLLPLGNRTVIEHCLSTIIASRVVDIVVVLGHDAGDISTAIHAFPVKTVFNEQQASEMAGSVRTGLPAVDPAATGILICLADHPLVTPETMKGLIALHEEHPESIIIPSFNRQRGHPPLFPREMLAEIFVSSSLRDVIHGHAESIIYLNTDDEGVLLDMDTMDAYKEILKKFNRGVRCL
jgi:molybdenum cofactor cytidylyltransferase